MRPTFLSLFAFLTVVTAQKSLFIPGFDPQPISADVAGVDQEGRTTWILQPGVFSGSFDDSGFIGTATLVEGPNDVSFTFVPPGNQFTLGLVCDFVDGQAVCVGSDQGQVATGTFPIEPFEVQLGTTIAPANGGASTDPTPAPGTNPAEGSAPTSQSRSGTGSVTATTTAPGSSNTNSAQLMIPNLVVALSSAVLALAVL